MTPSQYGQYLQMIGFMPPTYSPGEEYVDPLYDYQGYFGQGYSEEDIARTY